MTTISGRGVGLSVVRETVTGLRGTIDVRSLPGKGTTIRLSLPVNILARRLLLVSFRDTVYALPADAVAISRKLLKLPTEDLVRRIGQEDHLFGQRMRSPEAIAAFQNFFLRKRK